MQALDLLVIFLYVAGLVVMGGLFARRMSNTREMFAAGGQSPWWLSGLSAFMTMFSAGTFVVWGGISYRFGMVGVAICTTLGVSALLVGWFIAGVWKRQGVDSAAEFLELRFGRSLVQFYLWLQGTFGIFTIGGSIYALAVIICALVPLPAGHVLADPATGQLSIMLTSLLICVVVVGVCFIGGLWAVLMTDVLQFIILTAAVVLVVPLLFSRVGGVGTFVERAPEGFFKLTNGDFTWWFLAGWVLIHFFKIGGEWAYVQRFTCVPTDRDAKKAAWIFGVMYLVSPLFWMLPPMIYRIIDPGAPPEQAYILACKYVLPAGLMGLMVAAMSSATASGATATLNVCAGAFTTEVYQRLLRPGAPERELVLVGRLVTVALGGVVAAGALLIPIMGTYTGWILSTTAMLTGPLVLPTIWGLFSQKIGLRTAWAVTLGGSLIGLLVKFGLGPGGWFADVPALASLAALTQVNGRVTEIVVGVAVPVLFLAVAELIAREPSPGWARVEERRGRQREALPVLPSTLPGQLCGWSVAGLGVLLGGLSLVAGQDRATVAAFGGGLLVMGLVTLWMARERKTPVAAGVSR
jgi:Na+/proline symporter